MNHHKSEGFSREPGPTRASFKVAIVCYGHFDATLALARYLPRLEPEIQLDLIFLLTQSTSITVENVDFRGYHFDNGFVPADALRDALGPEFFDYIEDGARLRAFIFNSIKLTDFKNHQLLRQLKRKILFQEYDIIHFVGNNNDWIVGLNRAIKNVAKVHTMHEPYPFTELSPYRRFRYKRTIQQLLDTDSHIVVPSDISHKRLKKHFNTRQVDVSIIPFSAFEIYRSYGSSDVIREKNLLIYYGSISEYKGVPDLIDAMRMVYADNPAIRCIIAGAGALPDDLKLPPNVELINRYLGNAEIADLNRRARIVVCPYRSASQSGVVMTSFTFGNPILATSVGAFPEMIEEGKTGILVEPHNTRALSEAILTAFDQPKKLENMRHIVEERYGYEMAWSEIAVAHLELYRRLLRKENLLKQAL